MIKIKKNNIIIRDDDDEDCDDCDECDDGCGCDCIGTNHLRRDAARARIDPAYGINTGSMLRAAFYPPCSVVLHICRNPQMVI